MALSHNKQLYDISTRLAVYVEGVKADQTAQFDKILNRSNEAIGKLLWRVKYDTLDGLSKAQLNKLIVDLRKAQSKIYSAYTSKLIAMLREFMHVDLTVNRRVWVDSALSLEDYYEPSEEIPSDDEAIEYIENEGDSKQSLLGLTAITGVAGSVGTGRLWHTINNKPIPANGMTIDAFVRNFTLSAQARIENEFRKAWVNQLTVKQLQDELLSRSAQGTSSQMARIHNQSRAVIHSVIAEVHNTVTSGVSSALFRRYQWRSMMDDKTTAICKSRNLKIYVYGEGPLPPAHVNCRSHIVPLDNGEPYQVDESMVMWAKGQPQRVRNDMSMDRPMTLDRFANSVNILLWR